MNTGTVRGIPSLSKKEQEVCRPCQIDKQVKLSQFITTDYNNKGPRAATYGSHKINAG